MRAYDRLIKYTSYPAASDSTSASCPSTPEQLAFARALVEEMLSLGIKDAQVDENGYVYGTIEANIPNWQGPVIGFIAHMDVVRDVPYENIKPRLVEAYDGERFCSMQSRTSYSARQSFPLSKTMSVRI